MKRNQYESYRYRYKIHGHPCDSQPAVHVNKQFDTLDRPLKLFCPAIGEVNVNFMFHWPELFRSRSRSAHSRHICHRSEGAFGNHKSLNTSLRFDLNLRLIINARFLPKVMKKNKDTNTLFAGQRLV